MNAVSLSRLGLLLGVCNAGFRPRFARLRTFACLSVLFLLFGGVGHARERQAGTPDFSQDRESVARVATEAVHKWLGRMNRAFAKDYGFDSESDIDHATTLTPIPVYGALDASTLDRLKVEQMVQQRPSMWLVPIGIDRRILAVVLVESLPGKPPRPFQYGMAALARHLNAGLALLGSPPPAQWTNLRVFKFVDPTTDLLLFRGPHSGWSWVNLLATQSTSASLLRGNEVDSFLRNLNRGGSEPQQSLKPTVK